MRERDALIKKRAGVVQCIEELREDEARELDKLYDAGAARVADAHVAGRSAAEIKSIRAHMYQAEQKIREAFRNQREALIRDVTGWS